MKTSQKDTKTITYNYSKLLGKIKEIYDTQEKFSQALGIGRVSLSQRLNGKLEFSQNEILRASELLNIRKKDIPLYFFTEETVE